MSSLERLLDELRDDMAEAKPVRTMDSGAKKKKRTNFNPKKHRWVTMGGNPVIVPRRGGAPVNPPSWMSDKQGKKPSLLRRILDKLQKR